MTQAKEMTKTQLINWQYAIDAQRMIEHYLHLVANWVLELANSGPL